MPATASPFDLDGAGVSRTNYIKRMELNAVPNTALDLILPSNRANRVMSLTAIDVPAWFSYEDPTDETNRQPINANEVFQLDSFTEAETNVYVGSATASAIIVVALGRRVR